MQRMKRRPMPELLDNDAGTASEIAASLQDLRWFNHWFGGVNTVRAMLERVLEETRRGSLSLLELASGDGFVPGVLRDELAKEGVSLNVTLLDRVATHMPKNGASAKVTADALRLPFPPGSFDVVSCSLFMHHLAPPEVGAFLREALRVCRVAVLVHDLIRNPVHLAFAYAGLPLYRSRITRNDAPASIWQAYTVNEARRLFEQSEAAAVEVRARFFYRMGAIAWKRALSGNTR
jgi:ubiquinone/menaquinone biosynthesis C-methylase UbiE